MGVLANFKQPISFVKEFLLCRNLPLLFFHSHQPTLTLVSNFHTKQSRLPQLGAPQLHLPSAFIRLFAAPPFVSFLQQLPVFTSRLKRPRWSAGLYGCCMEPGRQALINLFPEQGNYRRYTASGHVADPQQDLLGLQYKTIRSSSPRCR